MLMWRSRSGRFIRSLGSEGKGVVPGRTCVMRGLDMAFGEGKEMGIVEYVLVHGDGE